MAEKILMVDDEKEIADLVGLYLSNEGYEVHKYYDADAAFDCIETEELDLAILDVMLPRASGYDICSKIREKHIYPVIMLTAKDDEISKITGLTLGADDYVTKPFAPLELIARVKAQLRRYKKYQGQENTANIIAIGDLVIDVLTHECTFNDELLQLTPTEFSILKLLCEREGQVMSAEDLAKAIWKDEYYFKGSRSITVHIRHIREKMGDSFENPRYIKTVWGVGYKIEGV
ncbi:MAG: response regulator transcription factor [Coriobacteriales bacterium]|jgi:two-component system response regulator VanR|nr:response regulator transcription factor [Coriobacteriales bacterium]